MTYYKKINKLSLIILLITISTTLKALDFQCSEEDSTKVQCLMNINGLNIIDIFPLDNPKRMVFDFKNTNNQNFNKVNSKLVTGLNNLRIGKHPDKVRVVLDIDKDTFNEIKWDKNDNQIIFTLLKATFEKSVEVKEKVEQIDEPVVKEITKKTVDPQPTPEGAPEVIINKDTDIFQDDESKSNIKNTEIEVVEPKYKEKSQELTKIEFLKDSNGKSNQIKLTLKKVPEFNMAKISNRTYRIKIPQAGLAQGLEALPYFPPHDIAKLVYLQPEEKSDNLYIEIGVERGARLRAIADNNSLVVAVLD